MRLEMGLGLGVGVVMGLWMTSGWSWARDGVIVEGWAWGLGWA